MRELIANQLPIQLYPKDNIEILVEKLTEKCECGVTLDQNCLYGEVDLHNISTLKIQFDCFCPSCGKEIDDQIRYRFTSEKTFRQEMRAGKFIDVSEHSKVLFTEK